MEKNAEEQNRRVITEAAKQDASEMKNSDSKKSKLQQESIELKKKLESDTLTHRESELALRKVSVSGLLLQELIPVLIVWRNLQYGSLLMPCDATPLQELPQSTPY